MLTFWRLHEVFCWTWFNASRRRPRRQKLSSRVYKVVLMDTDRLTSHCHHVSNSKKTAPFITVRRQISRAHTPPIRCTWQPSWHPRRALLITCRGNDIIALVRLIYFSFSLNFQPTRNCTYTLDHISSKYLIINFSSIESSNEWYFLRTRFYLRNVETTFF